MLRHLGRVIRFFSTPPQRPVDAEVQLSIRLSRANDIPDILSALETSETTYSHQVFGLRVIARVLKSSPSQRIELEDPRYEKMKLEAKASISKYTAQEVSDLCFWIRVMHWYKMKELNSEDAGALQDKIEELCATNAFNFRQLVSILFDLSKLGRFSSSLEDKVHEFLKDPHEVITFAEMRQILISILQPQRSVAKKVTNLCFERINQLDNERLDTFNCIGLLKILLSSKDTSEFPVLARLSARITEILKERMNTLNEYDLFKLLEIFETIPYTYRSLMGKTLNQLEAFLEENDSKKTILKSLISVSKIASHPFTNIPSGLQEQLLMKMRKVVDNFSAEDLAKVIYYGCKINKNFVDKSLLTRLASLPQFSALYFSMLIRTVNVVDPAFDSSLLLKDKSKLMDSFNDAYMSVKIIAIDNITASKVPEIQQLKSDFLSILTGMVSNDFLRSKQFAHEISMVKLRSSGMLSLSTVIDEAEKVLEENLTPESAPFVFSKMLHLRRMDMKKWKEFVDKNSSSLNQLVIRECLRESLIQAKHINHLLSKIDPPIELVLQASTHLSIDTSSDDVRSFLPFLNNQSPDIYGKLNTNHLTPFLKIVQKKKLTRNLNDFFQNLNETLRNSEDSNLGNLKACRVAAVLAQQGILEENLARRIIKLNESGRSRALIDSLIVIGSQFKDAFSDILEFRNKILQISELASPDTLSDRILACLEWDDNTIDEELLEAFKKCAKKTSSFNLPRYAPLIESMGVHSSTSHHKLIKGVTEEIAGQISLLDGRLLAEDAIKFLHAFAQHRFSTFPSAYETILKTLDRKNNTMHVDNSIQLLIALSRSGIKHKEIIKKHSLKLLEQSDSYKYTNLIVSVLSELGFQTEDWAREIFDNAMNLSEGKMNLIKGNSYFTHLLWGMLMFGAKEQHLDEAIGIYNEKSPAIPSIRDVLIHDHLRVVKTDTNFKPWLSLENKLGAILSYQHFGISKFTAMNLTQALAYSNVQFSEFSTVKDIWAPIYIHGKDTVVWPLSIVTQTHNKENLKGNMQMYKTNLEAVASKVLTLDYSVYSNSSQTKTWLESENLIG